MVEEFDLDLWSKALAPAPVAIPRWPVEDDDDVVLAPAPLARVIDPDVAVVLKSLRLPLWLGVGLLVLLLLK